MSKLTLALCLLLSGLCFVPALSIAADEKEDAKTTKEKPEKEEKKKPRSSIEWTEITSKTDTLKKPEYKKGWKTPPELPKVEFSTEAPATRIKWVTKNPEGKKGGSVSMTLFKKKESKGDKAVYQRIDRLGSARGESEGSKTLALPKGEYHIELDGDAITYEITIEAGEKKAAE